MPQTGNQNFGTVSEVAFGLWRAFYGDKSFNPPVADPESAQKALLFYAECLKAVSDEPFDVEAALRKPRPPG